MEKIKFSEAQMNDISTDKKAMAAAGAAGFCEIWQTGKQALGILQGVLKNPLVKVIVGVVIAAGDAVAKGLGCEQH